MGNGAMGGNVPSGPKVREWGKPQGAPSGPGGKGALGKDAQQGYQKPPGFVRGQSGAEGEEKEAAKPTKTDEELEADRKEARRRDEENSFRDVSSLSVWHSFSAYLLTSARCSENGDTNPENALVPKL